MTYTILLSEKPCYDEAYINYNCNRRALCSREVHNVSHMSVAYRYVSIQYFSNFDRVANKHLRTIKITIQYKDVNIEDSLKYLNKID